MSTRLSTLVWNAKPFGSTSMRMVLASLADQVNEANHGDWCYPSLQLIQDRTELKRRMVIYLLNRANDAGWLKVKVRPGYGNAYVFDMDKLSAHQREECKPCTRAYVAPVQYPTSRGAISDTEGCKILLPILKNQKGTRREPEPFLPLRGEPVLSSPVSGQKKPAKAKAPKAEKREADPRHMRFKAMLERYWTAARNRIAMPWGPGAAGALGILLSDNPHLDDDDFEVILQNRLESDGVAHSDHPKNWLANVVKYANEPLTKHQQPKGEANGTHRKGPGTSYETRTDRLKSDAAGAYNDVLARIAHARGTGTAGPLG